MSAPRTTETTEEIDYVDAILAHRDQDSRAAIETLQADSRYLRQDLALTEGAMSRGFTREWSPRLSGHEQITEDIARN
jgi:hypothetical protein